MLRGILGTIKVFNNDLSSLFSVVLEIQLRASCMLAKHLPTAELQAKPFKVFNGEFPIGSLHLRTLRNAATSSQQTHSDSYPPA